MNDREAICLKCGEWKRSPYAECGSCSFQPRPGSEEEIKSAYLSLGRFEDGSDRTDYSEELEQLASLIKNQVPINFETTELRRLDAQRRLVRSTSSKQAWLAILRLFLPAIWLLLALALLIIVLKALR